MNILLSRLLIIFFSINLFSDLSKAATSWTCTAVDGQIVFSGYNSNKTKASQLAISDCKKNSTISRNCKFSKCVSSTVTPKKQKHDEPSEEVQREADRRLDKSMRNATCEQSGRCRERTSSDPVPRDRLDELMEEMKCRTGGECIRP